ncbi:MAG: methyltransferase domain-containing protein [Candidatus Poribacteria bacterium]
MKKFQKIIYKLLKAGICPEYSDPHFSFKLEWDIMPDGVSPSSGLLTRERADRKQLQIDNFFQLIKSFIKGGETIVDFGSGSGNLSLPIAYLYPNCHFILIDRNDIPIRLGKIRISDSGIKNIEIFRGYIQDFNEKFDLGIALHACGEATDLAQMRCLENNVPYILCPCDIGYICASSLSYPRSSLFSKVITREEYNILAKTADWTGWKFESEQARAGKLCMGYVSYDRNLFAEQFNYETYLFTIHPREATPKNDIICGYPKGTNNIEVFERIKLHPYWVVKPDQLLDN